ncbi:MAG TPA: hypothetical protein VJV78_12240, partial [Polyangiales bacterium]|nr:hypothetical protein [Polyangiales bacterium]
MGWAAGVLGLLCASCAGEGDDGGMKLGVEPSPTAPVTGNTPPAMPAANSGAAGSAPSFTPA